LDAFFKTWDFLIKTFLFKKFFSFPDFLGKKGAKKNPSNSPLFFLLGSSWQPKKISFLFKKGILMDFFFFFFSNRGGQKFKNKRYWGGICKKIKRGVILGLIILNPPIPSKKRGGLFSQGGGTPKKAFFLF